MVATLTFDIENSISANGEVVRPESPACNATTLGMGFRNRLVLLRQSIYPASVRAVVQHGREFSGAGLGQPESRQFQGFILSRPQARTFRATCHRTTAASISWYNNFQLQVLYNPALNPRAPQ